MNYLIVPKRLAIGLSLALALCSSLEGVAETFNGKPCPSRPGSAYPNEGTGICRGNLSFGVSLPTLSFSLIYNSHLKRNFGYGMGWMVSTDNILEQTSSNTATLYSGDGTVIPMLKDAQGWNPKFPALFNDRFNDTDVQDITHVSRTGDFNNFLYLVPNPSNGLSRWAANTFQNRSGIYLFLGRTPNGQITNMTDRFGNKELFSYGVNNLLSSVLDLNSKKYEFFYDSVGNLTSIKYPNGDRQIFAYHPGTSLLSSQTDASLRPMTFTYFISGNDHALSTVTDREGYKTTYSYTSSQVSKQSFGQDLTEQFIPFNGGLSVETLSNGAVSKEVYDNELRLIQSVDHFLRSTTYSYIGVTPYLQSSISSDGTGILYEYDSRNFLIKKTVSFGSNSQVTNYGRNTYGDITSVTQNGLTRANFYDSRGNLTNVRDPASRTEFSAVYNANSQMTSVTDLNRYATTFEYDSLGKMVRSSHPDGDVVTYTKDALDQPVQIADNRGRQVTRVFDSIGREKEVTSTSTLTSTPIKKRIITEYAPTGTSSTTQTNHGLIPIHGSSNTTNSKGNLIYVKRLIP